ncbi:MAG: HAMP domain-containing sensor histidine kinase [Actinomycetota bacterium]|nr:HAMP domain-containing sensor histidine kinase [Actinomycetota bacterium]
MAIRHRDAGSAADMPTRSGRRDPARLVVRLGLTLRRSPRANGAHDGDPATPAPTGGNLVRRMAAWLPGNQVGLRARITTMFGLGALLLSALMGVGTYLVARQFTLHQRESSAMHETFVDASLARSSLRGPNPDVAALLESLDTSGSRSVLELRGRWFSASVPVGERSIPTAMRKLVGSGTAATELVDLGGNPVLAVGVPIASVGALYFEFVSFEDVARSLQILALVLTGAGVVTTVAGTVVGRWASGRALDPLSDVSHAAEIIARGQLGTRLQAADDADLSPLAESFNRMADALQERIEREARFTSDVSHELRSPLTTLSTSLGVLEAHGSGLSDRGHTALRLLGTEVRHFQRMVDDLLEISRVDTGAAVLSLDDVEVAELVDHMAAAGSARGVPVAIDPAVARLHLSVDKRRIERVIANLVANAAQYAGGATLLSAEPGGSGPPTSPLPGIGPPSPGASATPATTGGAAAGTPGEATVADGGLSSHRPAASPVAHVATRPAGTWVHLVVTDRGPGIAQDERQKIFERFYRGSAAGRRGTTEGTGLGLSLVAEHVRLHGGSVWFEDGPDGDNRFVVALPAHRGVPRPPAPLESSPAPATGRPSSPAPGSEHQPGEPHGPHELSETS